MMVIRSEARTVETEGGKGEQKIPEQRKKSRQERGCADKVNYEVCVSYLRGARLSLAIIV
jgi:hypothetical protein